ncbi:hypothetical protein HK102_006671, partial [Quaeritorhiza haematococci]
MNGTSADDTHTVPPPPCGFFDWTWEGRSIEFIYFQSRLCVPNKIIISLTLFHLIVQFTTLLGIIYFFYKDFRLFGRKWNISKTTYCFMLFGLTGAAVYVICDVAGSVLQAVVGLWMTMVGTFAMQTSTILVWAELGISLLNFNNTTKTVALRRLRNTLLFGTIAFTIVSIPISATKLFLYDFNDPYYYNVFTVVAGPILVIYVAIVALALHQFVSLLEHQLSDNNALEMNAASHVAT